MTTPKPSEWIEQQYCAGREAVGKNPSPPFGRTTAIMAYLDELAAQLPMAHNATMKALHKRFCEELYHGPGTELGLRAEIARQRSQIETLQEERRLLEKRTTHLYEERNALRAALQSIERTAAHTTDPALR